ncbi:MAG: asparaginase [Flavobacteriales bacterium]|nr:asparaginase [Flavobacteriales bacterium]
MVKQLPKILMIYTGGTIGMINDPENNMLKPFDFSQIKEEVPELNKIKCEIDAISFDNPVDSSNVNTEIWEKIGDLIWDKYEGYDGFVVLHGTDTMSFTASALSFMFVNLTKPIIFTGSQLPIGTVRTDGKENLITAIEIAADKKNGSPVIQEVAIYFEYQLFRANRTTKISSEHFDAFKSFNYPPLAEAGININYNHSSLFRSNVKEVDYFSGFNAGVSTIVFFPGITIDHLVHMFNNPQIKILILLTYGAGNLPLNDQLIDLIQKQIKKGKIIVNLSQCIAGKVDQSKYETGRQLESVGVIGAEDMTFEALISKSMLLLKKYQDVKEISKMLLHPLSGEISTLDT